ncbi:hypothetical protein PMIN06_007019 [Paraphaeosphaeria minitans]
MRIRALRRPSETPEPDVNEDVDEELDSMAQPSPVQSRPLLHVAKQAAPSISSGAHDGLTFRGRANELCKVRVAAGVMRSPSGGVFQHD